MTRKDGSYGKILSDVFVLVLDGQIQDGMDGAEDNKAVFNGKSVDEFGEMLDRILEQKFCEMLQELQKVLTEQISSQFRECISFRCRKFYGKHLCARNGTDAGVRMV